MRSTMGLALIAVALAIATGNASAFRNFEIAPGGRTRLPSSGNLLIRNIEHEIRCSVEFGGELPIGRVYGNRPRIRIGEMTTAEWRGCQEGFRIPDERLGFPWALEIVEILRHADGEAGENVAPEAMRGILAQLSRISVKIRIAGADCLYEGVVGLLYRTTRVGTDVRGGVTYQRYDPGPLTIVSGELARIEGGCGCAPEATISGSFGTYGPTTQFHYFS